MPRTPGGERPAPGSEQPGDQAVTEAAAGSPASQSRPPRPAPDSASTSDAGHDAPARNWLLRKKLLAPVVLAVIGVAFALVAWAIYPSRTQLPVPTYTTLHLISNTDINTVTYQVRPFSSSIALVKISVLLPSGSSGPHAGPPQASLYVFPPAGSSLICLPSSCFPQEGGNNYYYHRLTFVRAMGPGDLPNVRKVGINAFAAFAVRAHDFGVTADGATASAAIPKLHYTGPGTPSLITQYKIRSANLYDWSSLPPAYVNGSEAQWLEQMSGSGVLTDVDAVGANHAVQKQDSDLSFLAGVFLGVGGGALVGAAQEALHARE